MTTVRFGILGAARIARRIVAEMQSVDSIDVLGIASRDRARARWYADQYGIANAFESYEALLQSDHIDAVYIPLPPALHAQWCVAAAQAGKHVIVEKPIAINAQQTIDMEETCRKAGVRLLDATAWLHHPRTSRIAECVSSGRLGTVRHISVACSFFEPFQSDDHRLKPDLGGGCLLDLGWYAYGLTRWVAGRLPVATQSILRHHRDIAFRCNSLLDFDDGLTAMVSCGYDTATRKWFEIAGADASIVCDDFTRPWAQRPARFWLHDRAGNVESESFEGNQEAEMLKAFARMVLEKRDAADLFQQSLQTQQILDRVGKEALGQSVRIENE
ncbi:MAG: Gfo/Idh/MocA family oxidoreductase [Pirellulaceae bacterium]